MHARIYAKCSCVCRFAQVALGIHGGVLASGAAAASKSATSSKLGSTGDELEYGVIPKAEFEELVFRDQRTFRLLASLAAHRRAWESHCILTSTGHEVCAGLAVGRNALLMTVDRKVDDLSEAHIASATAPRAIDAGMMQQAK